MIRSFGDTFDPSNCCRLDPFATTPQPGTEGVLGLFVFAGPTDPVDVKPSVTLESSQRRIEVAAAERCRIVSTVMHRQVSDDHAIGGHRRRSTIATDRSDPICDIVSGRISREDGNGCRRVLDRGDGRSGTRQREGEIADSRTQIEGPLPGLSDCGHSDALVLITRAEHRDREIDLVGDAVFGVNRARTMLPGEVFDARSTVLPLDVALDDHGVGTAVQCQQRLSHFLRPFRGSPFEHDDRTDHGV